MCKKVIPAAEAAIGRAETAKEKAKEDKKKKKKKNAQGPGNDPNATKANLQKWIDRLCKEIADAKAALAKAKEHCK